MERKKGAGIMIRTVFFDVDGTLVSHSMGAVPDGTVRALRKLKASGIDRVLATGRHLLELNLLPMQELEFEDYILLNGQLCLDHDGQILFSNPIRGAEKEEILSLFEEKNIPVMLIEKDALYNNFIDERVIIAQKAISTPLPDVGDYQGGEIYQAIIFADKEMEEELAQRLPGCAITRWNDYAVDVISREGGKAAAIEKFLALKGLKKEESAAFGDGENDMEMLETVGIGVAMGNADDEVKAKADLITDSIDEDGLEKALIKMGLIEAD